MMSPKFGTKEFAEDFKKLMDAWDLLSAKVTSEYPDASEDYRYNLTKALMDNALGLEAT